MFDMLLLHPLQCCSAGDAVKMFESNDETLFALNSEFIQARAAALAQRQEVTQAADRKARIHALYQLALARSPEMAELNLALRYLENQEESSKPWQRLAHVLLATNEFVFVD